MAELNHALRTRSDLVKTTYNLVDSRAEGFAFLPEHNAALRRGRSTLSLGAYVPSTWLINLGNAARVCSKL